MLMNSGHSSVLLVYYITLHWIPIKKKYIYCVFEASLSHDIEKTVAFNKTLFLALKSLPNQAHKVSKWTSVYVLLSCITYRTIFQIFMSRHKIKVPQGQIFC